MTQNLKNANYFNLAKLLILSYLDNNKHDRIVRKIILVDYYFNRSVAAGLGFRAPFYKNNDSLNNPLKPSEQQKDI